MKKLSFFLLMITVFVLISCNSHEILTPIKTETIDFEIDMATEMIRNIDQLMFDLSLKETIMLAELDEIIKTFTEVYGHHAAETAYSTLIPRYADMDMPEEIKINANSFYPTIFHEGVELTEAIVHKSYYEDDFFNSTGLTVTLAYMGDDERLKNWKRSYIFFENKDGEWELHHFAGIGNYLGEEFHPRYLDLKNNSASFRP